MADIINLSNYIKKKDEKELDDLSSKLATMIEEMGLSTDFESYMNSSENYIYGMPYIYTIFPLQPEPEQVKTLADVTDVLTTLTIQLDEMGHTGWADDISKIIGEMFVSGSSVV